MKLARTLAWTLLIGCWLSLGALGQALMPLQAGGLVPIAIWLACSGLLLQFWRDPRWSGLLDCALLPRDGIPWHRPSAWPAFCARCAMLPMMATLALMAQWCGGFGLAPWQSVLLHLSAMVLPALLIRRFGWAIRRAVWITSAMALGLALLYLLPGLRGLMALSLCQSAAWGVAWLEPASRTPAGADRARPHWSFALIPALAALALGFAIDDAGPAALEAVQAALGLTACAGFLAGRWFTAQTALGSKS